MARTPSGAAAERDARGLAASAANAPRPAQSTQTPADQSLDLPLVQPANFQPADPFDDPFGDHATQTRTTHDGPLGDSRQTDGASAPRLLRPDTSRPIPAPAGAPGETRPAELAGQHAWSAIRLARAEEKNTSAEPALRSLLTPPDNSAPGTLSPPEELPAQAPLDDETLSAPDTDDLSPQQDADATLPDADTAPREQEPDTATGTEPAAEPVTPPSGLLPGFDQETAKSETPCDRMYGPEYQGGDGSAKRNCCGEEQHCQNALRLLRRRPISTISLDIAPPFDPKPESTDGDPVKKVETLAKSPPRIWRDADGRVLGSGRLVDRRSSRVVIAGDDGRQVAIPQFSLGDDELCFLNAWWGTPPECRLSGEQFAPRSWPPVTFTWKASALCHKPLYFEEQQLERYGHSAGPFVQPGLSAAHFVVNLLLLPYNMGVNPPNECIYALGYYRPGSCAPWLVPAFPLSLRGAAAQAAAVAVLVPLPY